MWRSFFFFSIINSILPTRVSRAAVKRSSEKNAGSGGRGYIVESVKLCRNLCCTPYRGISPHPRVECAVNTEDQSHSGE